MEVVRLGERYTSQYVPDELVEGYSSMIWTERFSGFGEFTLRTPLIEETRALLPEDTLISHLETDEVMMVDTHTVQTDDEGNEILVVTGLDLKSMLMHRHIEAAYQKKRKMRRNYTATAGLAVLLYNAFDNASGKDVTRGEDDPDIPGANDYDWNDKDKIPNISITDSVAVDGSAVTKRWWLNEGILWPQFETFMLKYDIGLRTIRPNKGSTAQVVTVKASPIADRGEVVRTATEGITSLRFDLYKGTDRGTDQNTNPKVGFTVLREDLENAQYLWSRRDYKTVIEIMSGVGVSDSYRSGMSALTGFERRVGVVDAGSPDIPPEPDRPQDPRKNATKQERENYQDALDTWRDKHARWANKRDTIVSNFKEDAKDDAAAELKKTKRKAILSGEVSLDTEFTYGVDYGLGDRVSLVGNYDLEQHVIVEEYIRTEDENGDTGIPGFAEP